ncbi:MAG: alpha-glucosidase/alpha-galactosidase [Oscillospiraceae bacterium]|jgi:alpha-galactosidase|nr:alpha-glucosidase/alpha-galactosidase [Oscillospiraceae bacterium]
MAVKVAFIGAGSVGFTRTLLADILSVPELQNIDVAFMDINARNLDMVTKLCQRDIDSNGLSIKILSTLDRREALAGARYVVNCARIGMLEAFELDVEIPLRYGVDQCVGDTLCAGGVMYGQRGIAFVLDVCKDIRELCAPGAVLLNYGNPNAMLTWAANKYGGVQTLGLCHGVQGGHKQIAGALGYKQDEVDIICAGLNHQTWYISVKHKGEELLDKILPAFEADADMSKWEKCRIDVLRNFGYYSTESNGHLSEYLMWYRKRPSDLQTWMHLDRWSGGETGGYLRCCREGRNWFESDFPNWMQEKPRVFAQEKRSQEHGSYILEGLETGRVYRGHFNVMNNGCITNLPEECVVEVPGYVDGNGISIPQVGELPLGCAAVCSQSAWVQRLAVEAAVAGDIDLLRQAMLMDPLTGAVCNPPEIRQMVDEMLVAQAEWLPQYGEAIVQAKERLAAGGLIPHRDYQGVRVHTKTVEEMQAQREENRRNAAKTDKT